MTQSNAVLLRKNLVENPLSPPDMLSAPGFSAIRKLSRNGLRDHQPPVERLGRPPVWQIKIVRAAAAILSNNAVWNRADDRKCSANATTWCIYCALEKATIDVTGGFNHRRPALETVREIVDQRTAGRDYHHRLMDYNNDPTTHLSDVQGLFKEAGSAIQSLRWWSAKKFL